MVVGSAEKGGKRGSPYDVQWNNWGDFTTQARYEKCPMTKQMLTGQAKDLQRSSSMTEEGSSQSFQFTIEGSSRDKQVVRSSSKTGGAGQ